MARRTCVGDKKQISIPVENEEEQQGRKATLGKTKKRGGGRRGEGALRLSFFQANSTISCIRRKDVCMCVIHVTHTTAATIDS